MPALPLQSILLILLGSALGGVARHWCVTAAASVFGTAFPFGTVLVNIAGSFVIGFANTLTLPDGRLPVHADWRLFLMVGLCGGYTTFSSFSLQTLALIQEGAIGRAALNVVASVLLCLLAVWLGHLAAAALNGPSPA